MLYLQVAELPDGSVAVHTSTTVPTEYEPLEALHDTVTEPLLSEAVATVGLSITDDWLTLIVVRLLAGHAIDGACLSCTVTEY